MKIVRNKYINAGLLLFLFSAVVHVAILVFIAAQQNSWRLLNYFVIMDVTYFFPQTGIGWGADVLSCVVVVILYFLILRMNKS